MSHIIKILSERTPKEHKELRREFQRIDEAEGTGYSFPCNSSGAVDTNDENYEYWKENFEYCISHPDEYEDCGVVCNSWEYIEPAKAKCSCGSEILLTDEYLGACKCECGQWYNLFGQSLLDPEYWEESYDY